MSSTQSLLVEPNDPDGEPRSDPVRMLLLPLWRSRYVVAATLVVGASVGLFFGLMQPNTYRSLGKLFLRPGAREAATTESLLDVQHGGGGPAQDYMPTELAILQTDELFERVAKAVSPPVLFSPYDPAAMDDKDTSPTMRLFHKAQAWWFTRGAGDAAEEETGHPIDDCPACVRLAAEALARNVRIEREGFTQIIDISYASHDPFLARRVVDEFLAAAVQRHQEHYDTSEPLEVVTEKLSTAKEEMEHAAAKLQEFRAACGFSDLPMQQPQLQTQYDALNQRLMEEQSQLEALRASRVEVARKRDEQPPTLEQPVITPPQPNPDRQRFKDKEYELASELATLKFESMSDDERKKATEKLNLQLQMVKEQLASMPMFVEAPTPLKQLVPNPIYEDYRKQLDSIDLEMTKLEARIPHETDALTELNDRIEKAASCGMGYQAAADLASKTRETYQNLLKSQERAESMNSLKDSNLQVIHDGTLPRDKEGPKRAKLLLVGLILGGMAGAALAFLRHMTDRTLRSPYDVERLLGMRVVGVLPRRSPPRSVRRAMRRAAL